MAIKVLVLLNLGSGVLACSESGDEQRMISEGFAHRGIEAEVRCVESERLAEEADGARYGSADAVIVGGGDGTLNTVANVLAYGDKPMGVLPLGTHNHFAKELGVPLDLDEAVASLADSLLHSRTVDLDVAQVNDRIFLNFSAIGLHPRVVRQRDLEHKALGRMVLLKKVFKRFLKLMALVIAFTKSLRHPPVRRVLIHADGRKISRLTPSIVVCSNSHQMELFGVQNPGGADRSQLSVFIAGATGPIGLVRLLLASFLRRLDKVRDFEAMRVPGLTVGLRRSKVSVSVDGEVIQMQPPLEYRVRQRGLRLVVP